MKELDHDALAMKNLEKMGYQQELSRSRGLFHILFMSLAIMAVPFGLSAPIATSLVGGGPATLVWSWLLISALTQPVALSLGEICSKYPTAAGPYYWTFRLASPKNRVLLSWINGWFTMVGVWTISLSVCFGTAQMIVAAVQIYKPDWETTTWQLYLIFLGVTLFSVAIGIFGNRWMPLLDILSAVWTLLGLIVILVALSVKASVGRHTAAYALGHYDPSPSGWNSGWTFWIGCLPGAYTYSAIGMVTNMAEEVHNPAVEVPRAIAWSIPIGTISGFMFLLPISFTLPDIATLLAVPSGQPIGLILELVMGSKGGGFGLLFIIIGVGLFCAISISCAASRATWSFARDRAIPFHKTFSRVNTSLDNVPVNAYILSTVIQLLLGLINFGSTAAFNAFVGVAVMCLGASYATPVVVLMIKNLGGGKGVGGERSGVEGAQFSLGRWGVWINFVAVAWIGLAMVLFSMPAVLPVKSMSMNYASVVFVAFGAFSAVWYFINGRYHYEGPPIAEESRDGSTGADTPPTGPVMKGDSSTDESRGELHEDGWKA